MDRKLRIAVSAFFAVVTVVICLLWVRSYYQRDNLKFRVPGVRAFTAESAIGQFGIFTYPDAEHWTPIQYYCVPTEIDPCHPADNEHGFKLRVGGGYAAFVVPHWLLIVGLAAALASRIHWPNQFSLRTLLIATTLVGVVLGLGAWAAS